MSERETMSDGMNLTEREAALVARRLVARQAQRVEEWLEWEDLPSLGQYAFERLEAAVADYGRQLSAEASMRDRLHDVDSMALIEGAEA